MEDRLLFGWGWGGWHSKELSSVGCPWICSVVTQPRTPWRSFRQLSRTRLAAALNSSLQRPTPDEQLQHTGQFPYKSPPPSPLSFTHSSSAYAFRHFDCANEHNTPSSPQTHTPSYCMMRSSWCVLSSVPLKHKEKQAPVKDNSAFQTLALPLPLATVGNRKVLDLDNAKYSSEICKTGAALAWEECITFKVKV